MAQYIARNPFSGSGNFTKTFPTQYESLFLYNSGSAALTFSTPAFTFTLDAGDTFDEVIDPFETLTITGMSSFRGFVREALY